MMHDLFGNSAIQKTNTGYFYMKIDARIQQEILSYLMTVQAYVENLKPQKNCASCKYFIESMGACEKYMQNPPEHIQKEGCEGWEIFNVIPF